MNVYGLDFLFLSLLQVGVALTMPASHTSLRLFQKLALFSFPLPVSVTGGRGTVPATEAGRGRWERRGDK